MVGRFPNSDRTGYRLRVAVRAAALLGIAILAVPATAPDAGARSDRLAATAEQLRAPVDPGAIQRWPDADAAGRAWQFPFKAVPSDTNDSPRRSPLILLENGRPLGPAHATHEEILQVGGGRFSHWNGHVIFSTSDNSDPRTNGRSYAVAYRAEPGPADTQAELAAPAADWPLVRAGEAVRSERLPGLDLQWIATATLFKHHMNLLVNPARPSLGDNGTVVFPVPGIYHLGPDDGGLFVLATGADALANADLVFQLVAASTLGGADEPDDFYARIPAHARELLTRPGQRDWSCGPQAHAMRVLLAKMGLRSRMVQWLGRDADGQCTAHQNLEVYLPDHGGWTLYDSHYGSAFRPGVTALDIFRAAVDNRPIVQDIRIHRPEAPWEDQPWHFHRLYAVAVGPLTDDDKLPEMATSPHDRLTGPAWWTRCIGGASAFVSPEALEASRYGPPRPASQIRTQP